MSAPKPFRAGLRAVYHRLLRRYGPQGWWPAETPIELLVGVILTQNTAWTSVERALGNLKRERLLSFRKLLDLPDQKLAVLIRPAGYFNLKTKRLKALLRFVEEEYGSTAAMYKEDGAVLREKLLGVYGVGKETADSILLYGAEKPYFVIDAYTKRVLSRHGLLPLEASYDAYHAFFHAHTRRETPFYNDYHAQIVRLCKEHCRAKPLCEGCPLNGWTGLPRSIPKRDR